MPTYNVDIPVKYKQHILKLLKASKTETIVIGQNRFTLVKSSEEPCPSVK